MPARFPLQQKRIGILDHFTFNLDLLTRDFPYSRILPVVKQSILQDNIQFDLRSDRLFYYYWHQRCAGIENGFYGKR